MGKNGRQTKLVRSVAVVETEDEASNVECIITILVSLIYIYVKVMHGDEAVDVAENVMDFNDDSELEDSEMDEAGGEEDAEWGGIPAEEDMSDGDGRGSGRERGPKVNVAPTRDEIRAINEASELFKSNTFKLQVSLYLCQSPRSN